MGMGVRVEEGGTNWEIRIDTFTMCKIERYWEPAVQHGALSSV